MGGSLFPINKVIKAIFTKRYVSSTAQRTRLTHRLAENEKVGASLTSVHQSGKATSITPGELTVKLFREALEAIQP